ncbi:MAG TPA: BamA/TamA family outer membrane protein [Candidatus Dormibacteraeota bacterium]|nr:BamA/TamA family outer membrane protein [Candidatus Dormibacteraeota bacterium]
MVMLISALVLHCWSPALRAQTNSSSAPQITNAPSKFRSADDGWVDISGFLEQKYGFLPIVIPITEPAVGYGAAGGVMFLSKPLPNAEAGLGRPNISIVGGLGTANGSWGALAGDMRYWCEDHLQTMVGLVYASANLDYYGIGSDRRLQDDPLRYNLEPKGGVAQARYRFGDSRIWGGVSYAFSATKVSFDEPSGTPKIPAFQHESNVGGFTPSLTYDTRDNFFTPIRGTYLDASVGLFSSALGSDQNFQRGRLIAIQFVPLGPRLFLGVRVEGAASFGNEPFYLRPFISTRGAPMLRYQGEEVAQIESELRWQFWKRFSVLGFAGGGMAWNHFERFDRTQAIPTGGVGFRYELARAYGLHMGMDVAFSPDSSALYIQVGSAWARP